MRLWPWDLGSQSRSYIGFCLEVAGTGGLFGIQTVKQSRANFLCVLMEPKPDSRNGFLDQKPISLKALVDKQNNRIIFAESGADFVDIVFSFLTMPMGTIIRNIRERLPVSGIGCIKNIYCSAENFDKSIFRTEAWKTMLLYPRNGATAQCKNLKLKIMDVEPLRYFLCCNSYCTRVSRLLSHYMDASCSCGKPMDREIVLSEKESEEVKSPDQYAGVFVEAVKYIVSDKLEVMPLSTATGYSILSKLGVTSSSTVEEREFSIGVTEVLDLLKLSLVSKTPLTKVLLKNEVVSELNNPDFCSGISVKHLKGEHGANHGGIRIKLKVSKSKNMLCFAEANEDFVNLLFSFITIPLGYLAKQLNGVCPDSKGCIKHIYRGVSDVVAQNYLKCDVDKEILLNPKVAPDFGYENQLLEVEKGYDQIYYYWYRKTSNFDDMLATNHMAFAKPRSWGGPYELSVNGPKTPHNESSSRGGGFVKGPSMFIITDNLTISHLSAISSVSILNEMKVDFSDIEEQVVHVGKDEAVNLLMASFTSETALTDVFLQTEPKFAPTDVNLPTKPKEERA